MTLDTFAINVGTALLLGVVIGLERQWGQHPAGLRTNALVALGAALFVAISALVERESSPTRIAAQVVSGLGFLGGGVIVREGLSVKGLNTAASLWCSGAIGALAGAGHPLEATLGTGAVLVVNVVLRPVGNWIDAQKLKRKNVETFYLLRIECAPEQDGVLRHILLRHIGDNPKLMLRGMTTELCGDGRLAVVADIYAPMRDDQVLEDIVARACIEPAVKAVSWKRSSG